MSPTLYHKSKEVILGGGKKEFPEANSFKHSPSSWDGKQPLKECHEQLLSYVGTDQKTA